MPHKQVHEIRDPIHVFIKLDEEERALIDSPPVQRLKHIHQLAMSYLLYPGATHKRFEHSLGVMHLAGRVFDVVTDELNIHDGVRDEVMPYIANPTSKGYWRSVVRMGALCHDIGHLPFSHAAEKELLPEGWNHERITANFILDDELREKWHTMTPPLRPIDVAKVAVGQEKLSAMCPKVDFSTWELLLSEIVTGDALGVDRIDYLLRDSHYAGVQYGRIDHHRLIDTLRILPWSTADDESNAPVLGIEQGGIHIAEALLLARYAMFKQVYLHDVRISYDLHLQEFLKSWLDGGQFPTEPEKLLQKTDVEVLYAIRSSAKEPDSPGFADACAITDRQHFRSVYRHQRTDLEHHEDPVRAVADHIRKQFGEKNVRVKPYRNPATVAVGADQKNDFPVSDGVGQVRSALGISDVLQHIPNVDEGVVLVHPDHARAARRWIDENKDTLWKT